MKTIFQIAVSLILYIGGNQMVAQETESQTIKCVIKGQVVNRESKTLILVQATESPTYSGFKIPIVNGRFEYTLYTPFIEKYFLIFEDEVINKSWRVTPFFPDTDTISFILHNEKDASKNTVFGGELNRILEIFEEQEKDNFFDPLMNPIVVSINSLQINDKYYSEEYKKIFKLKEKTKDSTELLNLYKEQVRLVKSGEYRTKESIRLEAKSDSVLRLVNKWENEYIMSHLDIFSYSLLISNLQQYSYRSNIIDIGFIKSIFPAFQKKYPIHPYTLMIQGIFDKMNTIKVGNPYIDFSASTIDGKSIKISDEIKGKVALIDLWATWCSPCRAFSKSIIPVYEKYKEKGFTVVSVAREEKNADAFLSVIAKDKYPWLNLIEIGDKNGIWKMYNIDESAGSTYLIDSKGIIIAINASAKEVEEILSKLLTPNTKF